MAILALLMIVAPYIAVSVAPSWRWLLVLSLIGGVFFDIFVFSDSALEGDRGFGVLFASVGLILFGLAIFLSGIKLWLKGKGNAFGQAFLPLLGVPLLVFCYLTIVMVF